MTFPLPHDLFHNYFIPTYFVESHVGDRLDSEPLPVMILVLQFVSKQWYSALNKSPSSARIISNFQNLPRRERLRRAVTCLSLACKKFGNSVSFIKYLIRTFRFPFSGHLFAAAAEGGHPDLLNWLQDRNGREWHWPEERFPLASCMKTFQWAMGRQHGGMSESVFFTRAAFRAAGDGNMPLLKFICEQNFRWWNTESTIDLFTSRTTIETLSFILDRTSKKLLNPLWAGALRPEVFRWAVEKRDLDIQRVDVYRTYTSSHPENLLYMYEKCPDYVSMHVIDLHLLIPACENLNLIRWAIEERMLELTDLCRFPTSLEMRKFLLSQYPKEKILPLLKKLPVQDTEQVQYLKEIGAPLPEERIRALFREYIISPSCFALDGVKYFIEEWKVDLNGLSDSISWQYVRKDVRLYLAARGVVEDEAKEKEKKKQKEREKCERDGKKQEKQMRPSKYHDPFASLY